jgi:NAD(P)-dependent dehydrogenase (short-subunit alcohol dehydrogenase family)
MGAGLLENLFSLKGEVALVTGGYRGIGLMFSETYAEAGADVVIAARTMEKCSEVASELSRKHGVGAAGKRLDIHDLESVDALVTETIDKFGKIDILVNCAGVPGSEKPVLDMTDQDIDDVMGVDFRGTFLTCRAVGAEMAKRGKGKIINVSSVLGKISARNMSGYCASKAAVIQLTRVLALELMSDNIQVNALCPGYFLTDFNRDFFQSDFGKAFVKKMIPLNRVGDVDELRSTALYLATCPAFLTGAEIYVDGGHGIA